MLNCLNDLVIKYEKPERFFNKKLSYGTAGFRFKAQDLDWIMYRMGMLSCLRSAFKNTQFIGCMITASHNPVEDNGCKLVDPCGEMLDEKWETYATDLVNSNDLKSTLIHLIQHFGLAENSISNVVVAYDTRPSCNELFQAFKSGVEELKGNLINYGLLSTPQLHFMVNRLNLNQVATEDAYFNKLSTSFNNLIHFYHQNHNVKNNRKSERQQLYVDGANGVGALKLKTLASLIQSSIQINIFNDSTQTDAKLNFNCGADFVKVQQTYPLNSPTSETTIKCASVDGDADRVVYYYKSNNNKFNLLDGDKISTLIASFIKDLVDKTSLDLKLGIVQTAYANGSSTNFIKNHLKIEVACVPTGVKHLHHKAQEYDIGVYFEANGHGTIIFSEKANKLIEDSYAQDNERFFELKNFKDCVNQTVGDALSDILIVEIVLCAKSLTLQEWNDFYIDLPNRQLKVSVKDRQAIETYDAERRVSKPNGLQEAIDGLLLRPNMRSFVRPSGTEDVIRVYAESQTQEECDKLAIDVARVVYDLAGGVGSRP